LARHGDQEGQPEHRVVFFSHGGFFMHLMCAMLDLPWKQAAAGMTSWFLLSNCSISRFNISRARVMICYLNRTEHLPAHLITG
jgi:broad specificity phosphatase PhoE